MKLVAALSACGLLVAGGCHSGEASKDANLEQVGMAQALEFEAQAKMCIEEKDKRMCGLAVKSGELSAKIAQDLCNKGSGEYCPTAKKARDTVELFKSRYGQH